MAFNRYCSRASNFSQRDKTCTRHCLRRPLGIDIVWSRKALCLTYYKLPYHMTELLKICGDCYSRVSWTVCKKRDIPLTVTSQLYPAFIFIYLWERRTYFYRSKYKIIRNGGLTLLICGLSASIVNTKKIYSSINTEPAWPEITYLT